MPGPTAASLRAGVHGARRRQPTAPTPIIPTVRCQPLGAGCDSISTSAGGATGVKGLNAVDSAVATHQPPRGHRAARPGPVRRQRIRRRDQQHRRDPGLQHGAPAPVRADPARHHHGAHRAGRGAAAATRPASSTRATAGTGSSPRSSRRAPRPAAARSPAASPAVANTCYEGIAVSQGSSPFGPYNVYYLNANYNPKEPGSRPCSTTSRRSA